MKSVASDKDPAFPVMAMDILSNVLSRSDNTGDLGTYLTEEVRDLTGARCVALFQCLCAPDVTECRVVGVNPAHRREWIESPAVNRLCEIVHRLSAAQLWRGEEPLEAAGFLRQEGYELSMVFPLNAGEFRVGAMLVLGLPDEEHITSVLNLLNNLSTIVALVLRNAILYEEQEQLVRERTAELRESNEKLATELTERKRAGEALHQSEERFRRLAENAQDVIYRMSLPDGKYEYISPAALSVLGYPPEEYDKNPLLFKQAIHPDWHSYFEEQWANLTKGEVPPTYEYQFIHKSGEARWLNQRNILVRDHAGNPMAIEGIVTDITERKRAEEALRRLNRELRALSNCNQVLVRAEDEQTLLNDICRIICDEAGYRIAWVGYAENDDAKTIRPVAWAGVEEGYLEQARLTWADSERGRGPAGKVIRTGKIICVQDFMNDPQMAPWREIALQRGYRSGIALPLKDESAHVFGVLLIYSAEANAFTPDEIRLMEELAGDLAFGIMILRARIERKRAEEELRRMNERFALAARAARLGVWDWDIRKNELVWDDGMYELYGIKQGDFAGAYEAWLQGIHPDDRASSDALSKKARLGECEYDTEFRVVWPDGSIHYLKAYGQIVKDSDGRPLRMTGINFDITKRRWAENELRHSNDVLRALIEAAPTAIIGLDLDGNVHSVWNPAAEKMLGWSAQEVMGHPLPTVPVESQDEFRRFREQIRSGKTIDGVEVRRQRRDGTPIDYSIYASPLRDASGRITGNIAVMVDITQHKREEKALAESEAKTRSILDNIGIGVALISPRMEILEMNNLMRTWFPAVDPGQRPLCYRAFNDPPREAACDSCPTWMTLQDGQVHEATRQIPRTGVVRTHRIVSSPVRTALGEVTAAIELVEDVTEKVSLESQLRQSQKMEAIGRLAGGVAHDFNNMLGVIIGRTEMALGELDPAPPLHAALQEIRKAAGRSADLTRQLLAFARKQTVAPRVLDLNETVEGMLKMLRRLIGEDINLAWLPGAGGWPIKMDPTQIDQILANLCVNARDAITGVGKIIIETHAESFDEAYCADHPGFVPGEYVLLVVSDDGCGMDRETVRSLFEPFFTTKETGKGTGLGLATVYGIVKQNSGFINVYSEPGHGTTFKIYLPRHEAETEQLREESPAAPAPRGYETLVLVEDEPAMLEIAKILLEKLGYRVLTASTPGEAIRMAKEHSGEIHLLITDVIMPEMNGRDLANTLVPLFPGMKSLFMSGYTSDIIAHHGLLDKGVHFIEKPFSMHALADKVREALGSI